MAGCATQHDPITPTVLRVDQLRPGPADFVVCDKCPAPTSKTVRIARPTLPAPAATPVIVAPPLAPVVQEAGPPPNTATVLPAPTKPTFKNKKRKGGIRPIKKKLSQPIKKC